MHRVSFGHEVHVQTTFGGVGTRHPPKFPSTSPMKQKRKLQQKPTKSRAWLEAECLNLARRTLGGSEIQLVTIRRLHPKGFRIRPPFGVREVRLYSRPGSDLARRFPQIVDALARLRSRSCIID